MQKREVGPITQQSLGSVLIAKEKLLILTQKSANLRNRLFLILVLIVVTGT